MALEPFPGDLQSALAAEVLTMAIQGLLPVFPENEDGASLTHNYTCFILTCTYKSKKNITSTINVGIFAI